MLIFGKQNILLSFRIFSALSIIVLCSVFFQLLNYNNNNNSKRKELDINSEKSLSCLNQKKNKFFWDLKQNRCNVIETDFGILYALSESRYIYYSFALFLGGVINHNKIIKVGVF